MSRRHVVLGLMWGFGVGMFARSVIDQLEKNAGYIRPGANPQEELVMPASSRNPLIDVLSPRIRKIAYAVLFVAALVYALFQAADGDWGTFIGSLLSSLLGLVAASNVKPEGVPPV